MNALLVDDERLARSELRRLLAVHPDVTIAGEAATVEEAEARLRELPIDRLRPSRTARTRAAARVHDGV